MRGPMNPGESAHRTGVLPSRSSHRSVRSTVAAVVRGPGTTSTSGMMCAGLSQCATRKRSGRATASARCDGEIVDEADATMASAEITSESRVKVARLSSTDSGSASCTNAHAPRSPSPIRSSIRSSPRAASSSGTTCSSTISATSRAISRRASASASSLSATERSLRSTSTTWWPASANVSAIWRPMRPGPRTATVSLMLRPDPSRKSSRCARPCCFVGGGPDGPLRNLPQHGWRGQSLETTIRSPVTPTPARRSSRCARPCRFVGGGPDGPLRNLPQHGWRGQSPRSKSARTPRSSRRRFAPLSRPLPPVNHHDVLAHAAVVVGEADLGVGDLPGAGLAA